MKRIAWGILMLCAIIIPAQGQQHRIRFGFSAATAIANWEGRDAKQLATSKASLFLTGSSSGGSGNGVIYQLSKEALFGYSAGALIEMRVLNHLSIQSALLFANMGCKVTGYIFIGENNRRSDYFETYLKLNYLKIPFLFIFNDADPADRSSAAFRFSVGPYYALNSKAYIPYFKFTNIDLEYGEQEIDGINKSEYGLIGGIGLLFPFGVNLNFLYQRGMSTLAEGSEAYNQTISIELGYLF